MLRITAPLLGSLAFVSGASSAPIFLTSVDGPEDSVQLTADGRIEARYKADTTNWDLRLENDGTPEVGDNLLNVSNGRGFFENQTFGFELAHDPGVGDVSFRITGPGASSRGLTLTPSPGLSLIQLSAGGSRGDVTLSNVAFNGLGESVTNFPSISAGPSGPTWDETILYLGDDADLLSGDWTLTGDVAFGSFTRSNPSEGMKMNVKLLGAIPSPGASVAMGVLCGAACLRRGRRRRPIVN